MCVYLSLSKQYMVRRFVSEAVVVCLFKVLGIGLFQGLVLKCVE